MSKSANGSSYAAAAVIVLLIAGGVGYYAWKQAQPEPAPVVALPAQPPSAPPTPVIEHPIEQALAPSVDDQPEAPLPPLESSDTSLVDALSALLGADALAMLQLNDALIQRFVATVDALPRDKVPPQLLPLRTPAGAYVVSIDPQNADRVVAGDNAARYEPYVRALEGADAQALVALYVRWYERFQQAYRELGYADAYFNDRLIAVIDHLIDAPEPPVGAELTKPRAAWVYSDAALESRSAGHKLMMRLAAPQQARVKAKLRELRALLVGNKTA
jgi:multidrug efflux pump subunit AcrA (membrane-fusion protein)